MKGREMSCRKDTNQRLLADVVTPKVGAFLRFVHEPSTVNMIVAVTPNDVLVVRVRGMSRMRKDVEYFDK